MRNPILREAKQIIRQYLQQIPEGKLCELAAWAKDGRMMYQECDRCFVGICESEVAASNRSMERLSGDRNGDWAFLMLGTPMADYQAAFWEPRGNRDSLRNLRLLPIVRSEMKRRDQLRKQYHGDVREESWQTK